MKKSSSILTITLLVLNVILNPIMMITSVYAEESGLEVEYSSETFDDNTDQVDAVEPSTESPIQEEVESDYEIEAEETFEGNGDGDAVTEEMSESSQLEESEESEEELDPVTGISFEGVVNNNIRTGSTIHVPVRVTNSEAALEDAILRYTISGDYIVPYDSLSSYFPNNTGSVEAYYSGNQLIVDYSLEKLSEEYNQLLTLALKTKDDGTMRNGATIAASAEVIQNGSSVAQSGNVNYQFVTRQPQFSTNVTYPSETGTSEDDDEGPARETAIAYNFSFGDEGGGDGSGQSAVTNLTVTTGVPESLNFDASQNEGWSYNDGTRTATYTVVPGDDIYSNGYQLPNLLTLQAKDATTDVEDVIYAEATFEFANGDVVTKTNQPEVMMMAMDVTPTAEATDIKVTSFEMTIINNDNTQTVVNNGDDIEVDVANLNSVLMSYGITIADDVNVEAGSTYVIDLPVIYGGGNVTGRPITIGGTQVASFDIIDGQVIITFNDRINDFDNRVMSVDLSGTFNTSIFEEQEEVIVEVPYSEGGSYTATLRPDRKDYEGQDRKDAGNSYILNADGTKEETDRNPTHVDWTVRVNDSAGSYENATIVDDLGDNLEIVADSFKVEKIIRNYNNEEIGREVVSVSPTITDTGFELDLGAIENAYSITYTTRVIRPEGGGTKTVNNNARIILDGAENEVNDGFEGSWSEDLPTITKEGNLVEGHKDLIEWQVEYNYGKENLGTVELTDVLSHGEIDPGSIKVYEVDPDIDGNVTLGEPVAGAFPLSLDAEGKAYYITFESSVPVGLNGTVINTISDNLEPQNSDDASVPVNTIPTGGKVGEQLIDENGQPYILWTITMNSEKVDVPSIQVLDVFNPDYLTLIENSYVLLQDGQPVDNYNAEAYTHTDGRTGFKLDVSNAGPHTYEFKYRTNYTTAGMQQPELANQAELVFLDGEGIGIGEVIRVNPSLTGPKAGISKRGEYVYAEENPTIAPQIRWTIGFNDSKILLNNPKITDTFTSGNYSYVDGTIEVRANGNPFTNYTFTEGVNGFELQINEETNAQFEVSFLTTVDKNANQSQENHALLEWQGGSEDASYTVNQREPGISKDATVKINEGGTKSIDWVINFNTNRQVLHGVTVQDSYSPASATVSDIKVFGNGTEISRSVTDSSEGSFSIDMGDLNPVPYQITYTTTLSASEEMSDVKNLATISYTGGEQTADKTINKPNLGVSKQATSLNKEAENPVISWQINANTDASNHYVNLVDAVLSDTIPADQRLLADTIQVKRAGADGTVVTGLTVNSDDNSFSINLPNGPYEYVVTFNTEILTFPSVNPQIDRYTNETTLSNTGYEPVSDDAYQDYFGGGDTGLISKEGAQNDDTENIDWTVTVNEEGLTINNPTITDSLSDNHTYVADSIKVSYGDSELSEGTDYSINFGEGNRSFTITSFADNVIKAPVNISYSTRLNPDIIGSRTVTNSIKLTGGTDNKELATKKSSTTAQQWFYGGGGSGTTVNFTLEKQHTIDEQSIQKIADVEFKLDRLNLAGTEVVESISLETDTDGTFSSGTIRAGRYVLTELSAPEQFQVLGDPINLTIGYAEGTTEEYVVTIIDGEATAEGNVITVENDIKKTSVTATKHWDEAPPMPMPVLFSAQENSAYPATWFKLYRYSSTGGEEAVPDAEIKQLASNSAVEEVTWDNVDKYTPNGEEYSFYVQEVDAEGNDFTPDGYHKQEEGLEVYNIKIEDPVITAVKQLVGRPLIEGEFSFELKNLHTGEVVSTATNDVQGNIVFTDFLTEAQRAELRDYGYVYQDYLISEISTDPIGGVEYDASTFRVYMVMLIDYDTGSIRAEFTYPDGTPIFKNTYEFGPSDIALEAKKILENKDLEEGQFSFDLIDAATNEVVQTKSNNGQGNVTFDKLTFETPGTYYYKVREVQGEAGGIDYDSTVYNVAIDVTDNTQGELVATARYMDGPLEFTNTYSTEPDRVAFTATKILEGSPLVAGQFSFELLDSEGNVLQTKTNNADGQVNFDEIHYDAIGEFEYSIREVQGALGGITYDESSFGVKVEVTDDGQGQLVAEASYTNGPAVFKNVYETTPDSVVFGARKTLTGQALPQGQFDFELVDSEGNVIETVSNNADGQVIFSEITYNEVGEHTYTIREVEGNQGGVTYDPAEFTVGVSVTDNGEGELVAVANYEDGPAHFTNVYETEPHSVAIEANKVLTGQSLRQGQFTFELIDSEDRIIQRAVNNGEGQIIFNEIEYDTAGEYEYTIREVQGSQGGMTYDDTVYPVLVTVSDDDEGKLTATVTYPDGEPVFENVYETAPDSVVFEASKTLTGQTLRQGQFEFELVDSEGAVIESVSNNANGQVIFTEIQYEEAGEHTYTIREVKGSQGGITYDTATFGVKVVVTDNGEGQLVAQTTYVNGPAHFTNSYQTAPDSATFEATKVLTGQELRQGQFSFELVDNASDAIIQRVVNNAEGQVIFNEIHYTEAGEYNYTIREVEGSQGGVTYDSTEYGVKVVVTDDGEGQLTAELTYSSEDVVFNNTYETQDGSAVIEASKVLLGQNLVNDRFDFNLLDEEENIIQTVSNNGRGQVIFDAIPYEEAGEYIYYIEEANDGQPGITYDENRIKVSVSVTDDGVGNLHSEVSYESEPTFTNTYGTVETTATIKGTKQLVGRDLLEGEFSFTLMDQNGEIVDTVTNDAEGNITFDGLTYTQPGSHTYIIAEAESGLGGITDDKQRYTVVVTVTDNNEGALEASVSYVTGPVIFTNTYSTAPDTVIIEAAKVLENQVLEAGQFSFELRDEAGELVQTKENDGFGNVYFDALELTEVGTFSYTVNEVQGDQGGMTYDTTVYPVVITVTDDGEGQLVAEAAYPDGPILFENLYETTPDSVVFEASKTLTGQALRQDQFEFELVDSEGNVIETVSNNANGQVIFSEITYNEVGEHTYTIREVKGSQGGITYDTATFGVKVVVTDNGEGQLVAQTTYVNGPAHFTNSYQTAPDSATFEATKVLTGQELRQGQFRFELVDNASDAIIQRVVNNAEGQVIFNEIHYTEVGEYTYTIREVEGSQGGVTYDSTEYGVKVVVTDDGEGQLVADVTYPDGPAQFNNTYEARPDQVVIEGHKSLSGKNLVAKQFEFELVDAEGNVLQTVTNNARGQFIFDALHYDTAGDYTYSVREVEGTQGGITYDSTVFEVEVSVVDTGEGQLVATAAYVDGPLDFVNTYTTAADSIVLEASKVLNGQVLLADQFEFELIDEAGDVIQTVGNNVDGKVYFNEIHYQEAGKFTYLIREVQGNQGGMTYDPTVRTVTVTVEDNGEGQLVASANYVGGPVVFTNTYVAAPGNIVLEASKVLTGQTLVDNQFTFELLNDTGEVIQTVTNNDLGQVIFEEISYDEVGQHHYTIREQAGSQRGMTYDSTEFTVVVDVVDDLEGQLVATASYNGNAVFENHYAPLATEVVVEADKVLIGRALSADEFNFELLDENGDVIATATNDNNSKVYFDALTYDTVGTYAYQIREVIGTDDNITYDETVFDLSVDVVDEDGQLVATATYGADDVAFNNTYAPHPGEFIFEVSKELTGRDLVAGEFSFELLDPQGQVLQTVTNDADGKVYFNAINYPEVGTYSYSIREAAGLDNTVTYDETVYEVSVEVTDEDGQLVVTPSFTEAIVFTNAYTPSVSVGDYVWIDENRDGLQDETDTPLPGVVLTIVDADGNPVVDIFGNPVGPQTTDENGYYSFDNLPIDNTYTVRIDREASADALAGLEPTLDGVGGDRGADSSTWEATSVEMVEDGQRDPTLDFGFVRVVEVMTITGEKIWEDNDNESGARPESITVELVHNDEIIETLEVTPDENGQWTFAFNDLPVLAEGETYEVREVAVSGYESVVSDIIDGFVTITNTYTPSVPPVTSVHLKAQKVLEGRELKDSEFEFELVENDIVISRAKNATDGSIDFGSIRYTELGTYNYIVREVQGSDATVTYDTTEYQVTVEVTSTDGQLVATVTYNTEDGEVPVFVNKAEPTDPTDPEEPEKSEDPEDPEDPTTPTDPDKPSKPGQSGGSNLPSTGEVSYVWIGLLVLVSGLGLVLSQKFKSRE